MLYLNLPAENKNKHKNEKARYFKRNTKWHHSLLE